MATCSTIAAGRYGADAATVWDVGRKPLAGEPVVINHNITLDEATAVLGSTTHAAGQIDFAGYTWTTSYYVTSGTNAKSTTGSGSLVVTGAATTSLNINAASMTWGFTGSINLTYAGASDRSYSFGTNRSVSNNITVAAGGAGLCNFQYTASLRIVSPGVLTINGPKKVQLPSGTDLITDLPPVLNSAADGAAIIGGSTLNGDLNTAGTNGFADWVEGVAGTSTVNRDIANQYEGASCCRLDVDASDSNCYIAQTATVVGTRYKFTCYAKVSDTTGAPTFRIGGTAAYKSWALTTEWVKYTGYFTADNTTFVVRKDANCASKSIYIDQVTLVPSNAIETFASTAGYPARIYCLPGGSIQYDWLVLQDWQVSQLVLNSGFETAGAGGPQGLFYIWAEYYSGAGMVSDETSVVHGGGHAVKVLRGASDANYIRTHSAGYFNVIPGTVFAYSFWTRGDGANAGRYFFQDATNAVGIGSVASTGVPGTTWTQVTGTVTVPATCYKMAIYFYPSTVAGSYVYFDDVSLKLSTPDNWYAGANSVLSTGGAIAEGYLGWHAGVAGGGPLVGSGGLVGDGVLVGTGGRIG